MTNEEKGRSAFTSAVLKYMDKKDFQSASEMVMFLVKGDTKKVKSLMEAVL